MVDLNLVLEEDILFKLQHSVNQWLMIVFHTVQVFIVIYVQGHFLGVREEVIIILKWFGILFRKVFIWFIIAVVLLFTKLIDIVGLGCGYLLSVVVESILVSRGFAFLNFLARSDDTFTFTFFAFAEIHTGPYQLSFNGFIGIWTID